MSNVKCCFCGENINSDNINPCELIVISNWDKSADQQNDQVFWTHMKCLSNKMHDSVKQYFVLDILKK